jgi:predicted AAA+ superfamily ATPase
LAEDHGAVIRRRLESELRRAAKSFPVVTLTGPRQSGKTTLCKAVFRGKPYVNLEAPDVAKFARDDPRAFLAQFTDGAVLDEVQRAPELPSYLQEIVDADRRPGRFVLTGSQNFALLDRVSQSLAGRAAVLHLLPLGLDEVRRFPHAPQDLEATVLAGGYPAVHAADASPDRWFASYTATYLERDVRQVLKVGDLSAFQTFLHLCAGRSGQLLNLSQLGADAGVSHNTAKAWISVLEAGFVVFRSTPLLRNLRKRVTRHPKLYFLDSGLLCRLLGIRTADAFRQHPLRGAVFETWVVAEILKARVHRGLRPDLCFYRDQAGNEADVVLDSGPRLTAVEIKSGQTVADDFFRGLDAFARIAEGAPDERRKVERVLVYGGDAGRRLSRARVLPWREVADFDWT